MVVRGCADVVVRGWADVVVRGWVDMVLVRRVGWYGGGEQRRMDVFRV